MQGNYISRILLCQVFIVDFYYNFCMKFKDRLKELRLEKMLSQSELASKIGVSQKAIDFWEKGTNEPKVSYVCALCEFFNVSADYLLGLVD